MAYIVKAKNGLLSLETGDRIKHNSRISDDAFPPDLMQALIDEGAIVPVPKPAPTPKAKPAGGSLPIKGMSPEQVAELGKLGIHTLEALADAPTDTLTQLDGIGPATAERWRVEARKQL